MPSGTIALLFLLVVSQSVQSIDTGIKINPPGAIIFDGISISENLDSELEISGNMRASGDVAVAGGLTVDGSLIAVGSGDTCSQVDLTVGDFLVVSGELAPWNSFLSIRMGDVTDMVLEYVIPSRFSHIYVRWTPDESSSRFRSDTVRLEVGGELKFTLYNTVSGTTYISMSDQDVGQTLRLTFASSSDEYHLHMSILEIDLICAENVDVAELSATTVKTTGDQSILGVKDFTDGMTVRGLAMYPVRIKVIKGTGGLVVPSEPATIPGLTYTFTANADCTYEVSVQVNYITNTGNTASTRQLITQIEGAGTILRKHDSSIYRFSDYQFNTVFFTWVGTLAAGSQTITVTTYGYENAGNAAVYYGEGWHDPNMIIKEYANNVLEL